MMLRGKPNSRRVYAIAQTVRQVLSRSFVFFFFVFLVDRLVRHVSSRRVLLAPGVEIGLGLRTLHYTLHGQLDSAACVHGLACSILLFFPFLPENPGVSHASGTGGRNVFLSLDGFV